MKHNLKRALITWFTLTWVGLNSAMAATIYIDQATGDDLNDGLTPNTAVATITQGQTLSGAGDTLDIGAGTYSETSGENYPLRISQNISLRGAGPDLTILDGELDQQIILVRDTASVINIDGVAWVNGGSNALKVFETTEFNLSNCRFENNITASNGSGAIFFDTREVNITDCHFTGNGGRNSIIQIQINLDFDIEVNVTDSTFINNDPKGGGAIKFQENGLGDHALNIDRSQFINNGDYAVEFQDNNGTGTVQISNSVFAEHSDHAIGISFGMIDVITVVNSTFINNEEALRANDQTTLINSIFWDNVTEISGDGGNVSFSIVQGFDLDENIDGGNNLDVNPLLDNDYRLMNNSPAIDVGSDQAVDDLGLTEDLGLNERKVDYLNLNRPEGVVDIGAHEFQDIIFFDGFEGL